ncbi:initiation control protein YabA [Dehalobacter sp. DCM]|uniref:initiation-control protein YabA n=1 Tax=Dehalobacter sp. DCM TaxID=2907827 RepID=UPI003081B789|nr:initiation control protein YabA [Dehalobacter sp. DCM]
MGQLYQAITEIEENLSSLLGEVKSLRQYIEYLEEENVKLKRQLCAVSEADTARVQKNGAKIQKEAQENLEKLYQEGFHVCHIYFGEPVEGSCIFCNAFLRKD